MNTEDIVQLRKLFDEANVPKKDRVISITKEGFIEVFTSMGGTVEEAIKFWEENSVSLD